MKVGSSVGVLVGAGVEVDVAVGSGVFVEVGLRKACVVIWANTVSKASCVAFAFPSEVRVRKEQPEMKNSTKMDTSEKNMFLRIVSS